MKWRVRCVVPACLLLLLVNGLPVAAEPGEATAWRAGDVVIDGSLGEWNLSAPITIREAAQVIIGQNFWSGPEDGSADFFVMWDDAALYLAAMVKDETPYMYREGFPPAEADTISLFISTSPAADRQRTAYASTDFRVLLIIDGYDFWTAIDRDMVVDNTGFESVGMYGYEQVLEGYEVAVVEVDGGYVLEARLPLAALANSQLLALAPAAGTSVGFDIELIDVDMPCPGVGVAALAWTGSEAIVASPAEWGVLRFGE